MEQEPYQEEALARLVEIMEVGDKDLRHRESQAMRTQIEQARWVFARLIDIPDEVLRAISERQVLPRPSVLDDTTRALQEVNVDITELSVNFNRVITFSGDKIRAVSQFLISQLDIEPSDVVKRQPRILSYSQERLEMWVESLEKRGFDREDISSRAYVFSKQPISRKNRRSSKLRDDS